MAACELVAGCFCCVPEQVWQAEWAWCKTKLRDGDTINRSRLLLDTHFPFQPPVPRNYPKQHRFGPLHIRPTISTSPTPPPLSILIIYSPHHTSHYPAKGVAALSLTARRPGCELNVCLCACVRPSIHLSIHLLLLEFHCCACTILFITIYKRFFVIDSFNLFLLAN